MSKSQNTCRALEPQAEDQQRVTLQIVESPLPDIGELDSILEGSEKVLSDASITGEHVDEMIRERAGLLERLQHTEAARDRRLQRVQDYIPLKDVDVGNYEALVFAGIVDSASAEKLMKLDDVISRLASLNQPTADSTAELNRLSYLRKSFRRQLEGQIKIRQREITERRSEVRTKVLDHYSRRTETLEAAIAGIEANPKVSAKLKVLAEEEKRRLEEEAEQFILTTGQYVQSLDARHAKVFRRLHEITDNENVVQDLLKAFLKERDQKQQSVFDSVRRHLIQSVIDGDGKGQLREPREVAPWVEHSAKIPYIEAMNTLRYHGTLELLGVMASDGHPEAVDLLRKCKQLADENTVLRRLVGRKHIEDRETGEKCLSPFWAAFETRKKNDKDGTTEARRKKREEVRMLEAKTRKAIADVIKQGGFSVTVPVYKGVKGRQQMVGKSEGAVRLERAKTKKENEVWRVAETAGGAEILEVGMTSPLNMSSFPSWIKESAKDKFIMRGQDFVELLVYDSDDAIDCQGGE